MEIKSYSSLLKLQRSFIQRIHIQRIREPHSTSFKLLSKKMWNFVYFATRQITDACFFFFQVDRINPVVLECREWAHSNGN